MGIINKLTLPKEIKQIRKFVEAFLSDEHPDVYSEVIEEAVFTVENPNNRQKFLDGIHKDGKTYEYFGLLITSLAVRRTLMNGARYFAYAGIKTGEGMRLEAVYGHIMNKMAALKYISKKEAKDSILSLKEDTAFIG